jgi:tetracycline repressor-like protein
MKSETKSWQVPKKVSGHALSGKVQFSGRLVEVCQDLQNDRDWAYAELPPVELLKNLKLDGYPIDSIETTASSSGGALARIESLVVTVSDWQSECLRGEPEPFKLVLVASAQHLGCAREFMNFLLQTITDLISEGVESGEFHVSNPDAVAQILIDCLEPALSLSASRALDNPLREQRVRAQDRF